MLLLWQAYFIQNPEESTNNSDMGLYNRRFLSSKHLTPDYLRDIKNNGIVQSVHADLFQGMCDQHRLQNKRVSNMSGLAKLALQMLKDCQTTDFVSAIIDVLRNSWYHKIDNMDV